MAKRNKVRYQVKNKPKISIVLTGKTYLKYVDDEAIETPLRGDMLVYPQNDALNSTRLGDYDSTGFSGYFKVDVFEGNVWCPVLLNDIFAHREHHFSKTECPIDTYHLCVEILTAMAGTSLIRTYREHYIPDDAPAPTTAEEKPS
jgi:hypothetical protein